MFIDKVIAGNREARQAFALRWTPKIRQVARKAFKLEGPEIDDAVQVSLIKIFDKLHTLDDLSKIDGWIYRVTLNTCRNLWREEKWDFRIAMPVLVDPHDNQEMAMINRELYESAIHFIMTLPAEQKIAMCLRLEQELDFAEIAKRMNCPYNTAKANYRHGVLKLRDHLRVLMGDVPQPISEQELSPRI